MDWNVINGILRAVVPAVLAYAVGKGWVTQSQAGDITAAVITLAAAGWSVKTNVGGNSDNNLAQRGGPKIGGAAVILLAIGLAALFATNARAADLGTNPLVGKAPIVVQPACQTISECTGIYAGFNFQQQGGNFTLLSNGLGGIAQNDFAAGGQAGYEFYNGQWRLGGEVGFDYGLAPSGTLPGGGNHGLWSADALVCVGYSLAPLFGGNATGSGSGGRSASITAWRRAARYPAAAIMACGRRPPWCASAIGSLPLSAATRPGGGALPSALIAKGGTLDADALHINYNNANVNATLAEQTENLARFGINYHFKP